jgi:hypothetical protein
MATPYLAASKIFINVGGRASTPPLPGLDQVSHTSCRTEKAKRFSSPQQGRADLEKKNETDAEGISRCNTLPECAGSCRSDLLLEGVRRQGDHAHAWPWGKHRAC